MSPGSPAEEAVLSNSIQRGFESHPGYIRFVGRRARVGRQAVSEAAWART